MDQETSRIMEDEVRFLQWNVQGIRNKKDELSEMIEEYKPAVIAVQETKIDNNKICNLTNYNYIHKDGHTNYTIHGGVGLYIHETVPYTEIALDTQYQAVAARIHIKRTLTVASIYLSRAHQINKQNLIKLIKQLPKPLILLGDFNSYNMMWGSRETDARGRVIEEVTTDMDLVILNNGQPTRISYNVETAIDLSMCTSRIAPDIEWNVETSPGDSDHCPIKVKYIVGNAPEEKEERWNMKRTNWEIFKSSDAWEKRPSNEESEELLGEIYQMFEVALSESTPKYTCTKFYPKPWWSLELKNSKNKRERLYKIYRDNKTLENAISWKKQRAIHKNLIIKSKKESWINLANTFTESTPTSKIYENIRRIKGKTTKQIKMIKEGDQIYASSEEIANKFAKHFENVSKFQNSDINFNQLRKQTETKKLNLYSNNSENYNTLFSNDEFEDAINKGKSKSLGTDNITYEMIRNMPEKGKEFCLHVMNTFWIRSFYPQKWKEATILTFLKPGKSSQHPSSYRPISITSNLGKIFERLINKRLTTFLEINGCIDEIQCGNMKGRSTEDHLVRLETEIRKSFAMNQHFISVFFDIEKAYDTAWRYGILRDIEQMGIKGRLAKIIGKFLNRRSFKVKIGDQVSEEKFPERGIPQGSVISPNLFIIKINSLAKVIPKEESYHASLFVDDFQAGYHHQDIKIAITKTQQIINKVHLWASLNGFKISPEKTKVVHFTVNSGIWLDLNFTMDKRKITTDSKVTFLGMIWDSKLNWKQHITALRAKVAKMTGIIKSITSQEWGGDQKTIINLYRTFIRSRIDYGSIVYSSASKTDLATLNSVSNDLLRMATGTFKSTPTESIQVIANEMPLELRREKLTLKYFYKVKSQVYNPAWKKTIPTNFNMLYGNKNIPKPIPFRAQVLIDEFNLKRNIIKPAFTYRLLNIKTPYYQVERPKINIELTELGKDQTSNFEYQQSFRELIQEKFRNTYHIYTDGSKNDQGVGSAACSRNKTRRATLPCEASIFTAELQAIDLAIQMVNETDKRNFTIFTDSFSSILALQKPEQSHPAVIQIQYKIHELKKRRKFITIAWTPSHVGIKGNERADLEANRASRSERECISIYYKDMFPVIEEKINQKWSRKWMESGNKLLQIKKVPTPWKTNSNLKRRDQNIVNRIRTGHTHLTHGYLMDGGNQNMIPVCEVCGMAQQTVKHILVECTRLEESRKKYWPQLTNRYNLEMMIGEKSNLKKLIEFLKEINAYDLI